MKLSPLLMCFTLLAACGDDRPLEEIVSFPDETGLEPRVAQVIDDARARVEADRRDVKAWRHLGAVLDAHRLSPSAESAYREALRLDEDDPWTCYQLAIVLAMMDKEPEEALLYGGRLVTSEYEEGDLVVFPVHTTDASVFSRRAALRTPMAPCYRCMRSTAQRPTPRRMRTGWGGCGCRSM